MPTEKKADSITELEQILRDYPMVVITDYRGLPTPALNDLRNRLRAVGGEFRVAKNTLLGIAANHVGIQGLDPILQGPMAMAVSHEQGAGLPKALADYIRISRLPLAIKGGVLDGQPLSASQVEMLATLPPKDQLRARLAGAIQGPLAGFVGILNSAPSQLLSVFAEREKQLSSAS